MIESVQQMAGDPTLVISVKETDKAVLWEGEDARPISEIRVVVRSLDRMQIEVRNHTSDGFNTPSTFEGSNTHRKKLMMDALACSGASSTGDRDQCEAEIDEFLNLHIGRSHEQWVQN